MVRRILIVALLAAATVSTAAADWKALKGDEITALLSGNTVKSSSFTEFYASDGTVRGVEGGEKYSGSWRIEGDKLCVHFPQFNYKDCMTVQKDGTAYRMVAKDKKPKITVVSGNPEDF
jgi:hypothetical protein